MNWYSTRIVMAFLERRTGRVGAVLCPNSQTPAKHKLPFANSYSAAFHVCDCVDKEKGAISGSIS